MKAPKVKGHNHKWVGTGCANCGIRKSTVKQEIAGEMRYVTTYYDMHGKELAGRPLCVKN